MSTFKRIAPIVALLALAACTDPAGPTDPVLTSAGEGIEQSDPADQERAQNRGGEQLNR